jgi:predicted GIY-YIG superfamily endonuclease
LYVGCTKDLKQRVKLHNAKKVSSTAKRTPFVLIYYEAYLNSTDAYNREKYMKSWNSKNFIEKVLANFFISKRFIG